VIEYRAILWKDMKFEGGFKLDKGTIIYARETPRGWLGTYYEPKGSGHGFALEEDDFAIMQSADCQVESLVVTPDPPTPPEELERQRELQRRRLRHQIARHLEAANELESLLGE